MMRFLTNTALLCLLAAQSHADPLTLSKRPIARIEAVVFTVPVAAVRPKARPEIAAIKSEQSQDTGFQSWLVEFASRAVSAGLKPEVLDRVIGQLQFQPDVIKRDRNQAEFTKTIWDYLDTAVSDTRIANGKNALGKNKQSLAAIEAQFGVDKEIVVAVWGLESAYGAFKGSEDTLSALATLAYEGRRAAFFEEQLIAALQIIQAGDVSPDAMRGSWAGAMGHTQFMPTSYLEHAVDFTNDGKRDIWGDDPRDALASTAAYLRNFGWTPGQPWGVEVTLPDGFDYTQADRKITKTAKDWVELGIMDVKGKPVSDYGMASILLPGGAKGAAFMIFDNFAVLERYNTADAYVIGVGHLADRLTGAESFRASWPRDDRALTFDERVELQERLTKAGFDTVKIDGKIGPLTIASVRGWQRAQGLVPDGYASLRALEALRKVP